MWPICVLGPNPTLEPGGLFVAHIDRRACDGCEPLQRGDRIQSLDGQPVSSDLL